MCCLDLNGFSWRYTFDLAKGGSLIAAEDKGPGCHNRYTYEFIQIDDVWLPQEAGTDPKKKAVTTKEVVFIENVINKDLPGNTFTMEALGVHQGCYIADHRIGMVYYYGGETAGRLTDWATGVASMPTVVAATGPDEASTSPERSPAKPDALQKSGGDAFPALAYARRWPYIVAGFMVMGIVVVVIMRRHSRRQQKTA